MTEERKEARRDMWKGLNFAGTIDWAIDLQNYDAMSEDGGEDGNDDEDGLPEGEPLPYCNGGGYKTLDELDNALDSFPRNCRAQYALETLDYVLDDSVTRYNKLIEDGYDHKFGKSSLLV